MRRLLTPLIIVLLGVAVALAVREFMRSRPATPSPVPAGDYEIAWIHTTTNPQTWERLVAAAFQIKRKFPGVQIDDSRAFLDQTAAVPEVVITVPGRSDKLRIRWYKLSSEVNTKDWVHALSRRYPAPLAFMGGSSSDRAIELAEALNEQADWKGARPLLFITTATANQVTDPETYKTESLIRLYPNRTFRGCFTNEAMARAVVDFVWKSKDLRPTGDQEARAYVMAWQDDPYSVDLADQFVQRFRERNDLPVPLKTVLDRIPYSVGTFTDPNPQERDVLDHRLLPELAAHPKDRAVLVLPAVTQPTRRMMRAFAADSPLVGWKQLVAVTGDGVSFNTVYRDADVIWPVQELSIPLVFFAHESPVAWSGGDGPADTASLHPPTATDDVLLFFDMINVAAQALYLGERVNDADKFGERVRAQPFYAADGERRTGEGEHIVVVRPQFGNDGRVSRETVLEVFKRKAGAWELVTRLVKEGPVGAN
ncbi:MAG TPA: hypothetical protein VHR66_19570 [Gemmataceae bacterium]|jgi:hypothetical protein|nr:hypothetical protein [Gemmataceae bacterium]